MDRKDSRSAAKQSSKASKLSGSGSVATTAPRTHPYPIPLDTATPPSSAPCASRLCSASASSLFWRGYSSHALAEEVAKMWMR